MSHISLLSVLVPNPPVWFHQRWSITTSWTVSGNGVIKNKPLPYAGHLLFWKQNCGWKKKLCFLRDFYKISWKSGRWPKGSVVCSCSSLWVNIKIICRIKMKKERNDLLEMPNVTLYILSGVPVRIWMRPWCILGTYTHCLSSSPTAYRTTPILLFQYLQHSEQHFLPVLCVP